MQFCVKISWQSNLTKNWKWDIKTVDITCGSFRTLCVIHYRALLYSSPKTSSWHVFSHRWMEVIRSATCSSSHIRPLSRKEPHAYWPKRPSDRLPKHQHTHTHTGRLRQVLNQVLLTHINILLMAEGLSGICFVCYIVISLYRKIQILNGFRCKVFWEYQGKSPENYYHHNIARWIDQQVKVKHFQLYRSF